MLPNGELDSTDAGLCMCVIHAGIYAANPVGDRPIVLGDVAQDVAFVVASEGPHGLADNVKG